jgi:hypothetical protein
MPAFGQLTERSLRILYGKAVNGSYIVRPGVTISASYGSNAEVCVLTIVGPTTEPELIGLVDQAVPAASRGLAPQSIIDCAGACLSIRAYERVTVSSAVIEGQIAHPAAIVTSKSKSCEAHAREARVQGFSIIRPKLP